MFGEISSDTYSSSVTVNNSGTGTVYIAHNGGANSITGDLTISATGNAGNVYVATQSGASLTIGGNCTISNTSIDNTTLYVGDNGDLTVNGDLTINNNGAGTNSLVYLADGATSTCIIDGSTTINSAGGTSNSRIYLGNNGDVTFNGPLSINISTGAANSEVRLNYSGTSTNTYNGNIVVENTNANGDGIRFGENGGTGVLAAGKNLTIGAGGFNSGDLEFRNFTRTGATTTTLTCTGTARIYSYDSFWNGDVNFTAPRILTRGSLYAGVTTLEKTGASDDASAGGNTFSDDLTATNSGSSYFMFGNGTNDTFSANVTLNNTGSDEIYFAQSGTGHAIAGNLTINNLGNSGNTNVIICDAGSADLTITGNTIINNNGTSTSNIVRFSDDGSVTIGGDLTITNTGSSASDIVYISYSSSSNTTINGNVSLSNSGSGNNKWIYFGTDGDITLNGNITSTNTSSATTSDVRLANNNNSTVSISGTSSFTNSGTGTSSYYYLGNQGDITFNDNVTAINTSGVTNSEIRFSYSGNSANTYNGSIIVESTNASGDGVSFGRNGGSGTLALGQTLTIGAGGFVAGDLLLRNFTQTGATSQNLTLTGTARFYPYGSTFNGDLTVSTPNIYNRQTTFNGITSLTKTGTSNEITYGGCTYNNVTFAISGTGYLALANNEANDYNGDVTLVQNSTGYFRPDYNRDCTIFGDLNLNLTTVTRFGDAAGSIIFDGNGNQAINDLGPAVEHIFEEMVVNKSGGELTINTPITVANSITLTQGIVNTTETNVITVVDNAVASGASDASYVDGPIIKLGNDDFTFPVGDVGNYQPIGISAPNSGSASFRAQYFMANPSNSFDINFNDANLDHVSSREFWILDRLATTASADVILSFDANSGDVDNLTDLREASWDGSEWVSEGNGGTTGTTAAGTLQSTTRVSSFSPFTFGSSTANNPLPVDLADFNGKCENENVEFSWTTLSELNNDYFEILASENGADFYSLSSINGKGTTNQSNHYH